MDKLLMEFKFRCAPSKSCMPEAVASARRGAAVHQSWATG
jgi:hypothetical protein